MSEDSTAILYGYCSSSAAWRVRIALNLKGVPVRHVPKHLRHGDQRSPEYVAINPQGLVPTLVLPDGTVLAQSLAIIEWLNETRPEPPFLPQDPIERARVRGFALAVAADTHPVQNLKVLKALRRNGLSEEAALDWARDVNATGLAACEALLVRTSGPFCFGPA